MDNASLQSIAMDDFNFRKPRVGNTIQRELRGDFSRVKDLSSVAVPKVEADIRPVRTLEISVPRTNIPPEIVARPNLAPRRDIATPPNIAGRVVNPPTSHHINIQEATSTTPVPSSVVGVTSVSSSDADAITVVAPEGQLYSRESEVPVSTETSGYQQPQSVPFEEDAYDENIADFFDAVEPFEPEPKPKINFAPSLIVLSFFVLVFGGIAGYASFGRSGQTRSATLATVPVEPEGNSTLGTTDAPGGLPQQNTGTLGANTTSNGGASSTANQNPPGPETFLQYDQYKDSKEALFGELVAGTGAAAEINKQITVYYKGWLTNGKLFDESKLDKPGGKLQPLSFTVGAGEVISGWEQAIIGMKVGGTRRMIIPPSVGYGATGKAPVPPNAVMVFDVQLIDVK